MPFTQKDRFLQLKTPAEDDFYLITGFTCTENVSGLFHISVDMVAEPNKVGGKSADTLADELIGKPMGIKLAMGMDADKYKAPFTHFNGICNRFSLMGKDDRFLYYHAELVPWTWLLTLTSDCRIFNKKSIPEIIEIVFNELKDKGFDFVDFGNAPGFSPGKYTKLDYGVQYRETNFNFISRSLEAEGIHYYFEHSEDGHKLMLADTDSTHSDCPNQANANFAPEGGANDCITSWRSEKELHPGKYTLRDFHFRKAKPSERKLEVSADAAKKVGNNGELEMYDYLGEFAQRFNEPERDLKLEQEGKKLVQSRIEEHETPHVDAVGAGGVRDFHSGYTFTLKQYGLDPSQNKKYLLTSVRHSATQNPDYYSQEDEDYRYKNSFTCIPADVKFRPQRTTAKPVVEGLQSAVVVGKSGQEIENDKYGRVKVKFHWERDDQPKDKEKRKNDEGQKSAWLRVAQVIAGKRWGAYFIPRIGQEVLVAFMEGDPDQAVIVGSVYNNDQLPPYLHDGLDDKHPNDPKVSGFKTNTTMDGEGYNELRFDDTKDKEQIYMHSQRNMDVRVLNDYIERIYGNRHEIIGWEKDGDKGGSHKQMIYQDKHSEVKGNQAEHIEGNMQLMIGNGDADDSGNMDVVIEKKETKKIGPDGQHLDVEGDCAENIGGSLSQQVGGDHQETVGMNYALESGMDVHIKGGMNVVIEAGLQLTLKVGSNFVSITPMGVDIQGTLVNINSGGSAGSGSGASPSGPEQAEEAAPDEPDMADESKSGTKSAP